MKKRLFILLLVSTAAVCFTACTGSKVVYKTIDAAAALNIANSKSITVLDVRTPEEFAEGHLPNAVNVNFLNASFAENIGNLNKKNKYLVYCRSGHRSTQAVVIMKQQHFKNVTNMLGGFSQWKGPVQK